jgi:hypothetical protein
MKISLSCSYITLNRPQETEVMFLLKTSAKFDRKMIESFSKTMPEELQKPSRQGSVFSKEPLQV